MVYLIEVMDHCSRMYLMLGPETFTCKPSTTVEEVAGLFEAAKREGRRYKYRYGEPDAVYGFTDGSAIN